MLREPFIVSVSNDEIYDLCNVLIGQASEVSYRASIGRAYYAVYHEAVKTADRIGLKNAPVMNAGTHERLYSRYSEPGGSLARLARRMRDCKRLRAKADYDLDCDVSKEQAQLHARQCQNLLSDLRRISAGSAKAGV